MCHAPAHPGFKMTHLAGRPTAVYYLVRFPGRGVRQGLTTERMDYADS